MIGDVDQKQITVCGHRRARGIYPENTMAGFQYLHDIGVNAVELDVQNTAGRLTVLAHDPYVNSEAGEHGSIQRKLVPDTTAEQLPLLKVGVLRPGSADMTLFPDQA